MLCELLVEGAIERSSHSPASSIHNFASDALLHSILFPEASVVWALRRRPLQAQSGLVL